MLQLALKRRVDRETYRDPGNAFLCIATTVKSPCQQWTLASTALRTVVEVTPRTGSGPI